MSNKEYIEIKFQIIVHIYFFFHVMERLSVKYSHEFGIFRYINVVEVLIKPNQEVILTF